MNGRFAEAFYNRGNVRQQLQDYDAAVADYEQALAIDTPHEQALRCAAAMLDEVQLCLHKRECIRLVDQGR